MVVKKTEKPARKTPVIRQGDKTKFIRGLPRSLAASEVVERCAKRDMIVSKAYVHNIRSAANNAARVLMKDSGLEATKGGRKKQESTFRALVVTMGARRAKQLLKEVEFSLTIVAATR